MTKSLMATAIASVLSVAAPSVRATGIPVVDVASLAQQSSHSTAELASMAKQLVEQIRIAKTAYDQYLQGKYMIEAVIGGRGFDLLLNGQLAAYMPADMQEMMSLAKTAQYTYGSVTGASTPYAKAMAASYAANSILPATTMASMTPTEQQIIHEARSHTAILASSSDVVYARAQKRIAHLQVLQSSIKAATDPAAKAELQVAVSIQQAMLQNEQLQMQALASSSKAEELAMRRRMDEQRIANIGRGADLKHVEF